MNPNIQAKKKATEVAQIALRALLLEEISPTCDPALLF